MSSHIAHTVLYDDNNLIMQDIDIDENGIYNDNFSTLPESCHDDEDDIINTDENSSLQRLVYLLFRRAAPVCVGFILMFLNNFITMTFAGHIQQLNNRTNGEESANAIFAGISLANMFAIVTFLSLAIGISSATDTLASQHFGGNNFQEVGFILQRSIAICICLTLPLIFLWFYSQEIFLYFGVELSVAIVIHKYLMIRIFSVPIDIIQICYDKYLAAIGVVTPPVYSNIAQNVTLVVCNSIFIFGFKYSYTALAYSWVIASFVSIFTMIAISLSHPSVQKTLQPINIKAAFSKWTEFICLALPGTLMLCSEWWSFEILTLMASKLGTAEVSAQTVIISVASLAYMIPLGISTSTSSLVGNFIGANKSMVAVRIGRIAVLSTTVSQSVLGILIYFLGHYLITSYTNNPEVLHIALKIIPFLSCFALVDGWVAVGSGILRGCGKQHIGAVSNILSYYILGLPMAYYLCFYTFFQVRGLIMGLSVGCCFQAGVLFSFIVFRQNYVFTSSISSGSSGSGSGSNMIHRYDTLLIQKEVEKDSNKQLTVSVSRDELYTEDDDDDDDDNHRNSLFALNIPIVSSSGNNSNSGSNSGSNNSIAKTIFINSNNTKTINNTHSNNTNNKNGSDNDINKNHSNSHTNSDNNSDSNNNSNNHSNTNNTSTATANNTSHHSINIGSPLSKLPEYQEL